MPNRIPIRFIESDDSAEKSAENNLSRPDDKRAAEKIKAETFAAELASTPATSPGPFTPSDSVQATVIDEHPDSPVKQEEAKDSGQSDNLMSLEDPLKAKDSTPEYVPHTSVVEPFDENIEVEPEEKPSVAQQALAVRLERVEAELALVDAERQNLVERLTRVSADFENYRKRADREKSRTYQSIVGEVVQQLLPVHDNLARALEAEASVQATESEEFRHFLNGVELIYRQLDEVFKGMGLQPVETVGLPFDPHVHEAVATEQTDEYEPDTVTQELVRGYLLGETLLRPAMVKVSTR
jgi:molecular chaperone GrpE